MADKFYVPVYIGMTGEQALPLRFGGRRPAEKTMIIFLRGCLPPGPHPKDWWSLPRGSAEFQNALRAVLEWHETLDRLPPYAREVIDHDA